MARCPCCGATADAFASVTSQSDLRDDLYAPARDTSAERRAAEGDLESVSPDPSQGTLWVEANVLACCNAAYERARAAGAAEVTLLDLLHAVCSAPTLTAWLAAYDIDGDLLRIEIEAQERHDQSEEGGGGFSAGPPRTSHQMKSALSAARREAERRLAVNLTIGDVLTAIQEQELGSGTSLLNAHVARERQRRRGGARGWQADAYGDLGALDSSRRRDDWTSVTREASNDAAAMHETVMHATVSSTGWLAERLEHDPRSHRLDHVWRVDATAAGESQGGALSVSAGGDDDAQGELLDDEDADENAAFAEDEDEAGRDAAAAEGTGENGSPDWQGRIIERLEVQALQLERLREELRGLRTQAPATVAESVEGTAAAGMASEAAKTAVDARHATASGTGRIAAVAVSGAAAAHASGAGGNTRQTRSAGRHAFLSRDRVRNDMRRTSRRRRQLSLAREREAAAVRQAQEREQQTRNAAQRMRMSVPPSATGSAGAGNPGGRPMGKPGAAMHAVKADDRALRAIDDDETDDLDTRHRTKRFYLSLSDDIVDAPSIGPKTAERLREHGINTVRDLLAVKAHVLSAKMGVRHITAERITSWQHQARLVCTIPWLRGTHAQILVGSGYYAPHSIVTANRDALCTAILRFATTREGQSVLRSSPPPSLGKIMRWVEQAAMAELDRAA